MKKTISQSIEALKQTNRELRFQSSVTDPLRAAIGQPTSAELVARAFDQGVDRDRLDALIAELEADLPLAADDEARGREPA